MFGKYVSYCMQMEIADYLIVGSGCTGAMVAETLCETGKHVLMIDVGLKNDVPTNFDTDFISIRKNEKAQGNALLGTKLEALEVPTHPNIPQQTAQRKFMTALTDQLIPMQSPDFFPVESLALGGLGNGWGLGSYVFSEKELTKIGLKNKMMQDAYKVVASRVGISGQESDDAAMYCHNQTIPLQRSIHINPVADSFYKRYEKKKLQFHQKGLFIGRPSLALLTENKDDRKAYAYRDLDFYCDDNKSAYRPAYTIQTLIQKGKLIYKDKLLVTRFVETDGIVKVTCKATDSGEIHVFKTRKLILASGTLGTTRIVLRSFNSSKKLPVLCNAYTYLPYVYLPFIGKKNDGAQSGLAQLALFYDKNKNHEEVAMASIYNYRSLLHYRILQQLPFNFADGSRLLKLMIPALFIAGIFHPAQYNKDNFVELRKDQACFTNDYLHTSYTYSKTEEQTIRETEKQIIAGIQSLSSIVLKKIRTLTGASIHYAGTLPFQDEEQLFSISPEGKLYGTEHVFIADGSGFAFLPGKGLTLSLMAYAHAVAENVKQHA
jgi:hypothetical protein